MTTKNTLFPRQADRLQGALDVVNRARAADLQSARDAFIAAEGVAPMAEVEKLRQRLELLVTPLPVEAEAEIAPCDDLDTLPGVQS
jgi:hypothetical protein